MYSWWSMRFRARERNAGWRIDYFLVSSRLADKIEKAEILMDVMGSDHCPVELDLTCERLPPLGEAKEENFKNLPRVCNIDSRGIRFDVLQKVKARGGVGTDK